MSDGNAKEQKEKVIDAIKAIIASGQPTFWGAVTAQTTLSQPQFEEQLVDWLKRL